MKHFKKIAIITILAGLACVRMTYAADPLPVFVSIPPQKYFVEKIGGNLVNVSIMVTPGSNPHNYEPKPIQMTALSKAKIYFAIGITFEDAWLSRFADINPKMRIVRTEEGIEKISMAPHEHPQAGDGRHPSKHMEEHETKDPHVWLSPMNGLIMAKNILKALQDQDQSSSQKYNDNYEAFVKEIENLDAELKSLFADKKGMKFMVFHPAWGYFAKAYDLVQVPIEVEGKEPKPAQLKELIQLAKKEKITVIFAQPQFSARSAETIAKEIGGKVVMADDLAADWAENLRNQARRILSVLK
jgi:zinc transport system substrate-binding protein